ncbi:MAG: hypothetical protein JXR36_01355 [Bacteroidales bacterium]|nr:hypothetical protein [Bacteroidales bacterium]
MKNRLLILISIAVAFVVSCSDDYTYNVTQKRLIDNTWQINTYVDYSQNNTVDIRTAKYFFKDKGDLIKIYDNNDTVFSTWSLSQNSLFLTIGGNTFRITELTNKVMSLRYGEVEMFFITVD